MKRYLKLLPPLLLVLLLGLLILSPVFASVSSNDGHLIYALDDPYIHMAIAKNLIQHGIWGISPTSFASASSSLMWPILNAVYFLIFGFNDLGPLILNIIFAILSIFLLYWIAQWMNIPGWLGAIIVIPAIFLAPTPAMVLTGMEHLAHFALSLAVIFLAVKVLTEDSVSIQIKILLLALTVFLAATRYEGIFLGISVAAGLLLIRKFRFSGTIALASFLPMAVYGMVSNANGWFFLPNPLILKTNIPMDGITVEFANRSIENGLKRIEEMPELQWLIIFSIVSLLFIWIFRKKGSQNLAWFHVLYLGMLVPHILWAGFGWFYRYEMYLMGTGIFLDLLTLVSILLLVPGSTVLRFSWRIILMLVLLVFGYRLFIDRSKANQEVVTATTNIYQQQYQMANFLAQYYPGAAVAINDIGAISYYSEVEVVDLWGLANRAVSSKIVYHTYDTESMIEITQSENVSIAMIYDSWFVGAIKVPADWINAGLWTIQHNIVCGDATVSIYALNEVESGALIKNLVEFSSRLPEDVIQRGRYVSLIK